MRKVTETTARAFILGETVKSGNSVTDFDVGISHYYLHGHLIAKYDRITGELRITMAGWPTVTTRERLNGILHYHASQHGYARKSVFQHNYVQYLVRAGDHLKDQIIELDSRSEYLIDKKGRVTGNVEASDG